MGQIFYKYIIMLIFMSSAYQFNVTKLTSNDVNTMYIIYKYTFLHLIVISNSHL